MQLFNSCIFTLLCVSLSSRTFTLGFILQVSNPFDPFRLECPLKHGVFKMTFQRLESVGGVRSDNMISNYCEALAVLYPSPRDSSAPPHDETCRWSNSFAIPGTFGLEETCGRSEFVAGVVRQNNNEYGFLCCRIADRKFGTCQTKTYSLPTPENSELTIQERGQLISGIGFGNDQLIVRHCEFLVMSQQEVDANFIADARGKLDRWFKASAKNQTKEVHGGGARPPASPRSSQPRGSPAPAGPPGDFRSAPPAGPPGDFRAAVIRPSNTAIQLKKAAAPPAVTPSVSEQFQQLNRQALSGNLIFTAVIRPTTTVRPLTTRRKPAITVNPFKTTVKVKSIERQAEIKSPPSVLTKSVNGTVTSKRPIGTKAGFTTKAPLTPQKSQLTTKQAKATKIIAKATPAKKVTTIALKVTTPKPAPTPTKPPTTKPSTSARPTTVSTTSKSTTQKPIQTTVKPTTSTKKILTTSTEKKKTPSPKTTAPSVASGSNEVDSSKEESAEVRPNTRLAINRLALNRQDLLSFNSLHNAKFLNPVNGSKGDNSKEGAADDENDIVYVDPLPSSEKPSAVEYYYYYEDGQPATRKTTQGPTTRATSTVSSIKKAVNNSIIEENDLNESNLPESNATTSTTAEPSTITSRVIATKKPIGKQFCDTQQATLSSGLVLACGQGADIWEPARCPKNTLCLESTNSNYRVCCSPQFGVS